MLGTLVLGGDPAHQRGVLGRQAAAAVFGRPVDPGQSGVEQFALPLLGPGDLGRLFVASGRRHAHHRVRSLTPAVHGPLPARYPRGEERVCLGRQLGEAGRVRRPARALVHRGAHASSPLARACRSTPLRILPVGFLGSSATTTSRCGTL